MVEYIKFWVASFLVSNGIFVLILIVMSIIGIVVHCRERASQERFVMNRLQRYTDWIDKTHFCRPYNPPNGYNDKDVINRLIKKGLVEHSEVICKDGLVRNLIRLKK